MSLKLTSPYMRGEKVRQIQRAAKERLNAKAISHPPVEIDGVYGPATARLVRRAAYYLGIRDTKDAERRETIILSPSKRTAAELRRSQERENAYESKRSAYDKATQWGKSKIGTVEKPAGSNQGPGISDWLEDVGIDFGAPWCGAFFAKACDIAGVPVTDESRYCPWIKKHAERGSGGYLRWTTSPSEAQKACDNGYVVACVFDFGGSELAHVGLLLSASSSSVECVEGNTSSSNAGSQANGGGVFERGRPISQVGGFAIVRKAK